MKTLFLTLFLYLTISLFYSCGDDTTGANNNPTGCTKTINLLSPPNDTILFLTGTHRIEFKWNKASCDPVKYIFQIVAEDTTHNGQFAYITQTTQTGNDTIMGIDFSYDSIPNFWRVKSIYTNPDDTFYSEWRKYIWYPN